MSLHTFTYCLSRDDETCLQAAARLLLDAHPAVREVHLDRVIRHIPTDSLSDQRAAVEVTPLAGDISALVEVYADAGQPALAAQASPGWREALGLLRQQAGLMFCLEGESNRAIDLKGTAQAGGFRRVMLLRRGSEKTAASFRSDWFGRHAALVRQLPQVDGYLQNLVTCCSDANGAPLAYDVLPADGLAQICYADSAAMDASYASPAREPLKADGRTLLSRINTFLLDTRILRPA
jgi:hypothetical protein